MSLSEKAKTAREIEMMISSARNEYRKSKLDSTILAELNALQEEKWVLVSVAQQEIGLANEESKRVRIMLEDVNMERGLQKQKLEQFRKWLLENYEHWNRQVILAKFEELFK
jgi:hypothetical protein